MVDLIPKEARKTGEGKGSVLVKKGCEIVRWFVSSYSCFFLSFPTSLTVPSQLLFFRPVEVVRPIFPVESLHLRYPNFAISVPFGSHYPHTPLYSHYVRSHLSHCLRLAFVLQSTRRASKNNNRDGVLDKSTGKSQPDTAFEWKQGSSNDTVTPMIQCAPIQHYTSVFCPCSFSTSSVSPSFVCFFLHFFRLSFFLAAVIVSSQLLSFFWSSRLSGLFEFFVLALICSDTGPTRYFRLFFFSFFFNFFGRTFSFVPVQPFL